MESSFKTKATYVLLSLAISGGCVYCMVEPLVRRSNALMSQQLESPIPGPFDNAFAGTLGKTENQRFKKKTMPEIPPFEPASLDFDWRSKMNKTYSVPRFE